VDASLTLQTHNQASTSVSATLTDVYNKVKVIFTSDFTNIFEMIHRLIWFTHKLIEFKGFTNKYKVISKCVI